MRGMKTTPLKPPVIRAARAEDAPALLALVRGLIAHQRDSDEHFDADQLTRDVFGSHAPGAPEVPGASGASDARLRALVAERDGALIGYAFFVDAYEGTYAQRGVYLCDLYVVPGARRSGVGRALVAGVAAAAKQEGRRFVWWVAKEWNAEARAFYGALGAICEPVTAHAITFDTFEALAEEGDKAGAKPPRSSRPSS